MGVCNSINNNKKKIHELNTKKSKNENKSNENNPNIIIKQLNLAEKNIPEETTEVSNNNQHNLKNSSKRRETIRRELDTSINNEFSLSNISHPSIHNIILNPLDNITNNNECDSITHRAEHLCNKCHKDFNSLMRYEQHLPNCTNRNQQRTENLIPSLNAMLNLVRNASSRSNMLALLSLNDVNESKEYIDWSYNKNTQIWYNKGKVNIDESSLDKICAMSENNVKYKKFYIKRIWFNRYINKNIYNKTNDNSPLVINRNNILEESYNQFMTSKELDLRGNMHIFFVDEIAFDVGGVYREWYFCLFREIFNENNHFFSLNINKGEGQGTYIIPAYTKNPFNRDILSYYNFIGKIIGKALLDKITLEMHLNRIILKHLMGYSLSEFILDDLNSYDQVIYSSLNTIRNSDMNKNEDLSFVWEINGKEIELIPNGKSLLIKNNNKAKFIQRVIEFICYESIKDKIDCIKKGFDFILGVKGCNSVLMIFSIEEFDFLLSGQSIIDLNDWKNNTVYLGYYSENYPTIKMFWDVLRELKHEELLAFYKFCTGSSRVPIDGFGALQGTRNILHKFCIESPSEKDKKGNNNRLIEAKTCFNKICLPEYENKDMMKKAIVTIISNDTDFFGLK